MEVSWLKWLLCACVSYLLGSLNPAIIISKLYKKVDIRTVGSGNAGMTNTLRVFGIKAAVIVAPLDALKTVAAVLISKAVLGWYGVFAAAAGVMLGHAYPVYFGFRGGKGVVCSATLCAFIDWKVLCMVLVIFAAVMAATKIMSASTLAAELSAPMIMIILGRPWDMVAAMAAIVLFVLWLHRKNVQRLIKGEEKPLVLKKGKGELEAK